MDYKTNNYLQLMDMELAQTIAIPKLWIYLFNHYLLS